MSLKVTNFGTNRKLIYDFLLVIHTNLPTILHRFKLWLIIGQIFASESGVSHFNALAGSPANIAINDYIANNKILWPTFPLQKVLEYLQPLLRNPFRKLPNSVKLRDR